MSVCVVDTNVPKMANLSNDPTSIPDNEIEMVLSCVTKIECITTHQRRLVMDCGSEIYNEYKRQLSMSGQPGVGDAFMKWVHDNCWGDMVDKVIITKNGDTYLQFPNNPSLSTFDKSDRKFVAVARAHAANPAIVVSKDRGWRNHSEALKAEGVVIEFCT